MLLWNCIESYCRIEFDQFGDITKYRSAFNDVKARLISLEKTDIKDWHAIIYVMGLLKQYPEWAQRQRAALRSKSSPQLEEIIEDLIDESRVQDTPESAYYGNKPPPQKRTGSDHKKDGDKKEFLCTWCKTNRHKSKDCLYTNKKLRDK